LITIIFACLLLTATAWSIEKVNTKDKPSREQISTDGKALDNTSESTNPSVKKTPADKKNYNDFVDRNNNGIDDRVESKNKQTKTAPPDNSKKTDKNATPSDTTKSGK